MKHTKECRKARDAREKAYEAWARASERRRKADLRWAAATERCIKVNG